jgi:hypothetical protein
LLLWLMWLRLLLLWLLCAGWLLWVLWSRLLWLRLHVHADVEQVQNPGSS